MSLYGIAILLAIIFCVYLFYKGIRERNIIKMIPLILLMIMGKVPIKGIIFLILMLFYFFV